MNFYAYLWLREDGTPYYVGKGCGRRAYKLYGRTVHPPTDHSRILIFHRSSEQEAFDTERELIRNWGRKDISTGCLRNRTDGGEGAVGTVWTEQQRQRLSEVQKKIHVSEKCRRQLQLINEAKKGKPRSESCRQKLSAALIGRPWSEARRSAWLRGISHVV
jgi:hypothetical protein